MLKRLPSLSQNDPEAYVFGTNATTRTGKLFWNCRRKLARDLNNPRLLTITLHDFRRWNGTRVALETRDPYAVMKALGHRSITSTEPYVDIEQLEPLQTMCKAATTLEEQISLIEQGFTFVKETKIGETTYSLFQKKVARRPD
jgi:integrase